MEALERAYQQQFEGRRRWALRHLHAGASLGASDLLARQQEQAANLRRLAAPSTAVAPVPRLKREVIPARPRVLLASPVFLAVTGGGLLFSIASLIASVLG
jgi:hypothetical protein